MSEYWRGADIPAVSETIVEAAQRSDRVLTADGAVLVFFFTPRVQAWTRGLGGEEGARRAQADIRRPPNPGYAAEEAWRTRVCD
jgi:hypothetical protein